MTSDSCTIWKQCWLIHLPKVRSLGVNIVGLFSGIGGLEIGFKEHGFTPEFLCELWDPARSVLSAHFHDTDLKGDIAEIRSLPDKVDVVTAGFPCTDLSQAGRTAGINGKESGLVSHVFRLLKGSQVEWLVLENVKNMLSLDKGKAMSYLTSQLEALGFTWAYRTVDSRFTGVPQRRHRVILVASRKHDPRGVLFADNAVEPSEQSLGDKACGFYWTEGLTGLGWAHESTPPLKGGSGVGIPSPPGIWIPGNPSGSRIVTPSIEDAEALQGFPRGWTWPAHTNRSNGPRWKLLGNAVTTGVSRWLARSLSDPREPVVEWVEMTGQDRWPRAAWGAAGKRHAVDASLWPTASQFTPLSQVVDIDRSKALSLRATKGFLSRAHRSRLRFHPDFLGDLQDHIDFWESGQFKQALASKSSK